MKMPTGKRLAVLGLALVGLGVSVSLIAVMNGGDFQLYMGLATVEVLVGGLFAFNLGYQSD